MGDQGGECDLQDQLNFFGSDSSRFFQLKRGVSDKNCGPFVKTIMTRCIHCTRCVRFLSEIGGNNSFGMLGRSSNAEIGLYISDNLKYEFSGNVIDLCPVGALTSKPYSFKGRSWELTNYRTIDILDSLNSDVIVSLKGFDVYGYCLVTHLLISQSGYQIVLDFFMIHSIFLELKSVGHVIIIVLLNGQRL